jgi:hypothetical protein
MKPYTLTLSAEEIMKLSYALKRGAFCASEAEKRGAIGGAEVAKQIEEYSTRFCRKFLRWPRLVREAGVASCR